MNISPGVHPTSTQHHRFHLLDALRGVAAILVVLWHAPSFIYPRGTHSTFLAVDFFFCLSGFVIAFSYERRLQSVFRFRDFVSARFIRLYPTFLLGSLFGLMIYLRFDLHHASRSVPVRYLAALVVMQLAMLPDYFIRILTLAFPFNYPAWSLFFEMLANIAYAFLLRIGLAKTWHLFAVIFFSFVVLFRYAIPSRLDVGWSNEPSQAYLGMARVLLSFLIGVLILRLYRLKPGLLAGRGRQIALALLLTVLLVTALHSPLPILRTNSFLFVNLLVVFPAIVYLGAHINVPQAWVPLCVFLGDTSYPVYLLHVPISRLQEILFSRVFYSPRLSRPVVPAAASWLFIVLVAALSLTLSKLVVVFFDTPARRFLKLRYNALFGVKSKSPSSREDISIHSYRSI